MKFFKRPSGTVVITSRITLVPGPDDQLIEMIEGTPDGEVAGLLRDIMRSGVEVIRRARSAVPKTATTPKTAPRQ